jgi:hypothetical protein
MTMIQNSCGEMRTPPNSYAVVANSSGKRSGSEPQMMRAALMHRIDMPTVAVMMFMIGTRRRRSVR